MPQALCSECKPVANKRKLVVIIDDHPLISTSLKDLVALHSFSAEVRTFSSFSASRIVLKNDRPVLVILDLGLPDILGAEATAVVRELAPDALLVLLAGDDERGQIGPDIQIKNTPFLHKGMPCHVMSRAMRDLLIRCGLTNMADQNTGIDRPIRERLERLSPKQREILRLLVTGRTNQEIAEAQNLSVATIKTHLHDIYVKLHVKSRTQAVLLYQSAGQSTQEQININLRMV